MVPAGPARSPGRHAVSEPADLAYLCHHYEDSPPRWTGVMRLLSAARSDFRRSRNRARQQDGCQDIVTLLAASYKR